ncbi:MAG: hypothetical protein J0G94_15550 [Sphingomonadales bacterium]|nr:hypothetical protein [Sphingomonadales bacterium]
MWTFDFAFDGKVDMMSINPLEMTNFEMVGTITAIVGLLLTILLGRIAKHREQRPHEFIDHEVDETTPG